jgi:DNA repair protein RecN (Recombination protein N)
MLRRLIIRNYALIDHIEWDVDRGWTVLTGETGSGKSILLGALGLVLGARAESVDTREGKCIVEAEFIPSEAAKGVLGALDEGDTCILRRSIAPGGRSRAYINDEPVKLHFLKELAPLLVDLHGQQDGQRLLTRDGLLDAVDAFSPEAQKEAARWKTAHAAWSDAIREHDVLLAEGQLPDADADYLAYQIEELSGIDFDDEGLRNLPTRLETLANAREIQAGLQQAHAVLSADGGALDRLHDAERALESMASVHPDSQALLDRLRSTRIELDDLAREAESQAEGIDLDPQALARAEADQDRINRLLDKHRASTLDDLANALAAMEQRLDTARNRDRKLAQWQQEIDSRRQALDGIGTALQTARDKAACTMCDALGGHLAHLKMPNAELSVSWDTPERPEATGPSRPGLLFTGNAGLSAQPLGKVASGGERSRVMLALKAALSRHLAVPTLILDEIDAGVSGDVAARMADLMAEIASRSQIITISHLPQVAGRADHHLKVSKSEEEGRVITRLSPLDADGRIEELAAMLSGSEIGDAAREQARSLMG